MPLVSFFVLGDGSENRGLDQFGLVRPLARRAVEQDRVPIGLPDGGQLDAPGSMPGKEDSTRPLAANENAFGYLEGAAL